MRSLNLLAAYSPILIALNPRSLSVPVAPQIVACRRCRRYVTAHMTLLLDVTCCLHLQGKKVKVVKHRATFCSNHITTLKKEVEYFFEIVLNLLSDYPE
jgi:hypothetical protein